MAHPKEISLLQGHRKAIGFSKESLPQAAPVVESENHVPNPLEVLLKDIPPHVVKKAWFTLSHILPSVGAKIIDAGCNDGMMAYVMAALKPDVNFVGMDIDANRIRQAQKNYRLKNLTYTLGNIYTDLTENSADAIINSFFLHEIYSDSFFNERLIELALQKQYKALKNGGTLIIRDYMNPTTHEYVQIEFTDLGTAGDTFETCSEADLLVWFSENARAKSLQDGFNDNDCGFFLEELPQNFPRTRLFRIPEKWAHEFILRKDNRDRLKEELSKEYAFYSEPDFQKHFTALGARLTYSAPSWDEGFLKTRYTGKIRLYDEAGNKLGPPPTSHILVVNKISEKISQSVQERRTSRTRKGSVYLRTVRDDNKGTISDIICRDLEFAEIIPFRITTNEKIKIYLHEGVTRGLANAVPRMGKNIDGRKWSGHMIEAIGVNEALVSPLKDKGINELQIFARTHIGLRPSTDSKLLEGGGFYPDPNRIDERVLTYYFRVEDYHEPFEVKESLKDIDGYSSKGTVREFDAQDILNAIAVGLIPTSRLEIQILALYQLLGMKAECWGEMPIQISEVPFEETLNIAQIMKQYSLSDDRFKPVRGQAGQVRLLQSVFVEEGREKNGAVAGLCARDVEFAVQEDNTINTAVVLPLVKSLNGEVLAGVVSQYLPVPQRFAGTGQTLTLPSFNLPKEVTDMEAARHYIAKQFDVKPEFVGRMGESYFTHIGITPHRIYPFVVTNIKRAFAGRGHGSTSLTMLKNLWKILYWDNNDSFMKITAMALQNLHDSDMSVKRSFDFSMAAEAQKTTLSESTVISYSSSPQHDSEMDGEQDESSDQIAVEDHFSGESLTRSPKNP
ncbi:MAG: methyltransferase domain-containing protein [Alphaproteobacteria bacterium]|nr:methyltransferase domain-containing protein [Alphaproteobacteria bacterium]MCB1550375.1 methyltransferase domain-containing protein [Alphaproteobacteria bacterium]MCB9985274.1 methyltransferase domain-containing protein [Micavibrio sp.]